MTDNQKAYLRALRLLSIKARFQRELEQRLKQELFSDQAVAYAMEKCLRYFDDEELGSSKIRSKAKKGFGTKYIAANLRQYMPEDKIEEAIVEFDEAQALSDYIEKHPKLLTDPKGKLRLLRRGFNLQTINEVFAKYRLTNL